MFPEALAYLFKNPEHIVCHVVRVVAASTADAFSPTFNPEMIQRLAGQYAFASIRLQ